MFIYSFTFLSWWQSESKRPKAGSLFLDEEDDEGNLFGTAVPKPTKKAESSNKKLPEGVPLLSEDPFGEVTTKKQEKEVSKPKVSIERIHKSMPSFSLQQCIST